LTAALSANGLTLTVSKADGTTASITAFESVLRGVVFTHSISVTTAEIAAGRTVTITATDGGNQIVGATSVALSLSARAAAASSVARFVTSATTERRAFVNSGNDSASSDSASPDPPSRFVSEGGNKNSISHARAMPNPLR
jgi:D-serine deaminase-like pyridoxal phosphate-dependent protein